MNTENAGGLKGLGHPTTGELLAVLQESRLHLAVLAAGGHDQHDPVTLVCGLAHHPRAGDALVVGMRVERHQCGHAAEGTAGCRR